MTRHRLHDVAADSEVTVETPAAAKLMLAILLPIGLRLREAADKLKIQVQLTQAMAQEIGSRINA